VDRQQRRRSSPPRSVPWNVDDETDVVAVDTTWGELQPLEAAPGVRTVGECELLRLIDEGALVVDCRTRGSFGGRTVPGSVLLPYDEIIARRDELDPQRLSVLFCNGPQCPQSQRAIRELLDAGHPASGLAYYRGGMHDWVTLALPTEPREDCPGGSSRLPRAAAERPPGPCCRRSRRRRPVDASQAYTHS
jgi:rhodanese-related sulfurtransferase